MKLAALALLPIIPFRAEFERVAGDRWPERAAQVWQESRFRWGVVNKASGAMGGGQFLPGTWQEEKDRGVIPQDASPFDPRWTIVANHDYMNRQETFARRTLPGVDPWIGGLVCYNWGPRNWQKAVRRAQSSGCTGSMAWVRFSPQESQDYIRVIPAKAVEYRALRGA